VLRGKAGVGKTALLDYAAQSASGFRVAQAAGVEADVDLAFAGLHQLCAPMLGTCGRCSPSSASSRVGSCADAQKSRNP